MRNIIVFDFETSGLEPRNSLTDIVQIAACAIDAHKLEVIPNSEFNIDVRPDTIESPEYYEQHKNTIQFHLENQKTTWDKLLERWKAGVKEKKAWKMFKNYCDEYAKANKMQGLPAPAGKNIINFDLPISDRVNEKYEMKEFFFRRDAVDLDQLCLYWFMYHADAPPNNKLDTLRPYMGLASDNAHDALFDVRQEAQILIKFLKLHKRFANSVMFRDCFLRKE